MSILAFIIIGLIAGLIARALIPGHASLGLIRTTLLGMVGSLLGGALHSLLFSNGQALVVHPSGLIASIIGSILVLALAGIARSGQRA